jgi:hypothetical protein
VNKVTAVITAISITPMQTFLLFIAMPRRKTATIKLGLTKYADAKENYLEQILKIYR